MSLQMKQTPLNPYPPPDHICPPYSSMFPERQQMIHHKSEDNLFENHKSEDNLFEDYKSEDNQFEDYKSEDNQFEDYKSEDNLFEVYKSEDNLFRDLKGSLDNWQIWALMQTPMTNQNLLAIPANNYAQTILSLITIKLNPYSVSGIHCMPQIKKFAQNRHYIKGQICDNDQVALSIGHKTPNFFYLLTKMATPTAFFRG
ncbi:uncharacterized protein LOC143037918 [Oratosquilla oratoria]|uniref:uncharacterized protein LOC143037918 n=1 Tax=Oratosquilla oratoria TaxID=337810 RepID=UPI003F75A8FD